MRVVIVGCGFSGITTAKTLLELGHEVVIFEKCPDVGGVWSKTRRYPGLATQNTKDTYCLSDLPMPSHYPAWPAGEQVQAYLEAYVAKHDLQKVIKTSTEVVEMVRSDEANWLVKTSDGQTTKADHVVVCNGIFSEGFVPDYPGKAEFEAEGGQVLHTSQVNADLSRLAGKKVAVVGYGKSSCDVAFAISKVASSTTVIARRLIWKLPRKIRGLTYKFLLLTRLGEALFEYIKPSSSVERFLHGAGKGLRNSVVDSLEWVVKGQLKLERLGLVPEGSFETIARSTISLSTEGFYDAVQRGQIAVKRDSKIDKLVAGKGVLLDDGSLVEADVVICGTGFRQDPPPFLPEKIRNTLTDEAGNWLLYRHIKPIFVDDVTFNGFNSSLFCPTSSEAGALWIAAYLARGNSMLPETREEQMRETREKLDWLEERSKGKHAHGTNLVPFSLHSIDDTLQDVGVDLSRWQRFKQWLLPVDPTAYKGLVGQLRKKLDQEGSLAN